MGVGKRLAVCYLVPGHTLLPSAGPTRNVLSVARELAKWTDLSNSAGIRVD